VTSKPAVEAHGLRKAFGQVKALDGLSLAVPVVFLLVFTAFVPAVAMPGWLQAFGTHQPVDALVNAERALILGGPAAHDVVISLAWSGGLLVVFALLAARTYARMGR
jgi:ABC-type multidrug transport system permease subunit